jgi:hypothetical protein
MDGAPAQGVVVEQQHGLLCGLGVAEGDETIALQGSSCDDTAAVAQQQ